MSSQRISLSLRKMAPGAMGGQSRVATPAAASARCISVTIPSSVEPCPVIADVAWSANLDTSSAVAGYFVSIDETGTQSSNLWIVEPT
jgi:hypothetical protein